MKVIPLTILKAITLAKLIVLIVLLIIKIIVIKMIQNDNLEKNFIRNPLKNGDKEPRSASQNHHYFSNILVEKPNYAGEKSKPIKSD